MKTFSTALLLISTVCAHPALLQDRQDMPAQAEMPEAAVPEVCVVHSSPAVLTANVYLGCSPGSMHTFENHESGQKIDLLNRLRLRQMRQLLQLLRYALVTSTQP